MSATGVLFISGLLPGFVASLVFFKRNSDSVRARGATLRAQGGPDACLKPVFATECSNLRFELDARTEARNVAIAAGISVAVLGAATITSIVLRPKGTRIFPDLFADFPTKTAKLGVIGTW